MAVLTARLTLLTENAGTVQNSFITTQGAVPVVLNDAEHEMIVITILVIITTLWNIVIMTLI